jgi:hypothetical protein
MTGKSREHIGHLLHQGRGRLECQKISTTLQSVLRTLTRSAEPVKLLNSTTRPTRFEVFNIATSYIVYDVMYNTPIGCLWLCRVVDIFDIPSGILLDVEDVLCAVYSFPSIGKSNEIRFLLFYNQKTSSVISYHLQKTLCRNAYWDQLYRNSQFYW